jgi:hypothetical protein
MGFPQNTRQGCKAETGQPEGQGAEASQTWGLRRARRPDHGQPTEKSFCFFFQKEVFVSSVLF